MRKEGHTDFTEGPIVGPLLRFVVPVLLAMFLQAMYGAVDLLIVGQFALAADVSAVSTGSQMMLMVTGIVSALAMGMTILIAEKIGQKQPEEGGRIVGGGISLFIAIGLFLTLFFTLLAGPLARLMQAPAEAFSRTAAYVRICGGGTLVITAYNLIGSVFRGIGDSRTPFVTVLIACVFNIAGDLLLVAVLHMGAQGAALATVGAQLISVVISYFLIKRRTLPFRLEKGAVRWDRKIVRRILRVGTPIAMQDLLISISFLVLLAIVNSLGLVVSAGVGVAEKVCGLIMLVPAAFMQSLAAFVAQNRGAGKIDRAVRGFWSAVAISTACGCAMFFVTFFHGDLLASVFAKDPEIITAAFEFLKAYGIDCMFTCFMFCFTGFFNGMEYTRFVMIQSLVGAFLIRIPVAWVMSRQVPVSAFHVGLATPCATLVQIVMFFICYAVWKKRQSAETIRNS